MLKNDKTLKSKTELIFKTIGDELGMSPESVHLSISRHLDEIFNDSEVKCFATKPNKEHNEDDDDSDDVDWNYTDLNGIITTVNLSDTQKQPFNLVDANVNGRSRTRMESGWTDAMSNIIRDYTGAPCLLNFMHYNIVVNEITTTAKCGECHGFIKVISSNDRSTLKISIEYGSGEHTHTKFRRLTQARANDVREKLRDSNVHKVYMAQAKNISISDDNLPRDHLTKKSIANIQHRANATAVSPVDSLRAMKYNSEHSDSIHEISTDPFCVLFWSNDQKHYYFQTKNKCISIDATGGLIKNSSLLTDIRAKLQHDIVLPHVFLYLISVKSQGGSSVPVGQMLSAQQDTVKISYFLKRWLFQFSKPIEIVMDDSKALLKASSISFADCFSTNEYVSKCFDVLMGGPKPANLVWIRLDATHFIHSLHRNKHMKKLSSKAKQLFLSSFGFLMQCEDYGIILNVFEDMLILANSRFIGTSLANESQQNLTKLVTTHEIDFMIDEKERWDQDDVSEVSIFEEIENDESENNVKICFFDNILEKVTTELAKQTKKSKAKKDTSIYYNESLNEVFKKYFNRLPLWSAVMRSHFKSPNIIATSNDTESRFQVIKNVLFGKLPTNPDVFVDTLLTEVSALAKLTKLEIQHKENVLRFVSIQSY